MGEWVVSGFGASEAAVSHLNGWLGAKRIEQIFPAAWIFHGELEWSDSAQRFCEEAMIDANPMNPIQKAAGIRGIAIDPAGMLRAWDLDGLWWKMGLRTLGSICSSKGMRALALDPSGAIGERGRQSLGEHWEWAAAIPNEGRGWIAGVARPDSVVGQAMQIAMPSECAAEVWSGRAGPKLRFSSPDILGAWL